MNDEVLCSYCGALVALRSESPIGMVFDCRCGRCREADALAYGRTGTVRAAIAARNGAFGVSIADAFKRNRNDKGGLLRALETIDRYDPPEPIPVEDEC